MSNIIKLIHDYIATAIPIGDFWLHFFIFGTAGVVLYTILCAFGIRNFTAWAVSLTVIVVSALGVELLQLYTGTGAFEYTDILAALAGYLLLTYAGIIRELLP